MPEKNKKEVQKNTNTKSGVSNMLIENFVSLQKVMTNLGERFDVLSSQISKLLELFEISAKTFTEKEVIVEKNRDNREVYREVVEKLNVLLEQNKTIARGLTLLHEQQIPRTPIYEASTIQPSGYPQQSSKSYQPMQQDKSKEKFRKELS